MYSLVRHSFRSTSRLIHTNPTRIISSVRQASSSTSSSKSSSKSLQSCQGNNIPRPTNTLMSLSLSSVNSDAFRFPFARSLLSAMAFTASAASVVYLSSHFETIAAQSDSHNGHHNEKDPHTLVPSPLRDALDALLGDRFTEHMHERESHGKDLVKTYHASRMPQAVVFPLTTEEVAEIVRLCNTHRVPIIPYGSGTSLEGHTSALQGGVCIDMSHMKKILVLHDDDMQVTVQPGISWNELNEHLQPYGLMLGVDPGPDASIGGMVSTRCSGTLAVRHGTMRENVVNLKVVLPSGEVIQTARRVKKSAAGYDMTHLIIGAEGTLGIVTEATLKLVPIPKHSAVAICQFSSIQNAANTSRQILRQGIHPGRIEFLDQVMVKAINMDSEINLAEEPATLLIELQGRSEAQIRDEIQTVEQIVSANQGIGFKVATDPHGRAELWRARKIAYFTSDRLRPGSHKLVTDVCVPLSRVGECIELTIEDIKQSNIIAPIVGHLGDGNFHLIMLLDPDSREEYEEAHRLNDRLVARALAMEGTCTGEHGVGVGKKKFLLQEHGPIAIQLMRDIKKAIDPNMIMNPGKMLP
eukprot:TRINITY_DN9661_c0_g1_i1.p1 TRINITY_DN9661_c0_g1~~TRINITY_DN9661_c0_g1_i1.p1  ORF type:complete len:582 (-),score=135.39 TRINITY_DN9661_c0_g1_i1:228-1973(-)